MSRKTVLISDVSKPYRSIEVHPDKTLYIDGYKFPIPIKTDSSKIKVKEQREIKKSKEIPDMVELLKGHGITFTLAKEDTAKSVLTYINYNEYRLNSARNYQSVLNR